LCSDASILLCLISVLLYRGTFYITDIHFTHIIAVIGPRLLRVHGHGAGQHRGGRPRAQSAADRASEAPGGERKQVLTRTCKKCRCFASIFITVTGILFICSLGADVELLPRLASETDPEELKKKVFFGSVFSLSLFLSSHLCAGSSSLSPRPAMFTVHRSPPRMHFAHRRSSIWPGTTRPDKSCFCRICAPCAPTWRPNTRT